MTATMQRAMNILKAMPESEVERFITMNIRYEQAGTSDEFDRAKFDSDMDQCQQWAQDVGLTPDDITRVIKRVRQKKRQQA